MQVAALRENSDYFRRGLLDLGCNVLGEWGSPVMVREQAALGAPCTARLRAMGFAQLPLLWQAHWGCPLWACPAQARLCLGAIRFKEGVGVGGCSSVASREKH